MPRGGGHSSKPSLGLAGDTEQLSALDHGPLSPMQTNIQMDLEEEQTDEEVQDQHDHAMDDVEESTSTNSPSHRISLNNDPSRSGEFDTKEPTGCQGCIRKILNAPVLSVIFPTTLVLSIVYTMLNVVAAPDAFKYLADPKNQPAFLPSSAGFVISLLFTIIITILIMLATRQMLYDIFSGEIRVPRIIGLYLATIINYGNIYQLCLMFDVTSFGFASGALGVNATTNVFSIWIAMVYYSVQAITCTGYGDIYPTYAIPKIIASSELILAVLYQVGIFSVGLERFQNHVEGVATGKKSLMDSALVNTAKEKMRDLRTKYPRLDKVRKFFISAVFPVSLLIQLVFLLILHLADPDMFNHDSGSANGGIIFIFFIAQIVQFILILLMSLSLVRQINKSYVSPSFLIQSWLATVSLFAGFYVLIHLLVPGYGAFYLFNPTYQPAPYPVILVVGQFFWFSLNTMTTTGSGDVYPIHIVARLFSSIQMIISVCYTVVILGQALASTVGFINQVRLQRGAELLNSAHTKHPVAGSGKKSTGASSSGSGTHSRGVSFAPGGPQGPALEHYESGDESADEHVEQLSFSRDVGSDHDVSASASASELDSEMDDGGSMSVSLDVSESEMDAPQARASQQQQQRKGAHHPSAQSQPPAAAVRGKMPWKQQAQTLRTQAKAPPPAQPQPQSPVQATPPTKSMLAAKKAASATLPPEWTPEPVPAQAPSIASQVGSAVGSASVSGGRALASLKSSASAAAQRASQAVEASHPGLQASVQAKASEAVRSAKSAAEPGLEKAKQAARSAEQEFDRSHPGLKPEVKRTVQDARTVAAVGGAVAKVAAEEMVEGAMQDPSVRSVVNKAQPRMQQAKQSLAQAGAKAKAAAQEAQRAAQHQRQQSRGMFDESESETEQ